MSTSAVRSPITITVADPFKVGTATAMTRTGADAIVVSRTTVSPAATAACASASRVIGPSPGSPAMTPTPLAPAGTGKPGPGARTIPMVPEASPPMTRPGWLGSDVTPTTCVAPIVTGPNPAPESSSTRALSCAVPPADRLVAAAT